MNNIYTVPEVDHNNGQILGYKLHGVRKGDLFSKMNLKSNDIITSVNGQSMQKSNILSLYEGLHNDNEVNFTYERGGMKHSVKVQVR